jgi:hypothetical protein
LKTADDTEDNEDEVTVVGYTMTNTVPVPGFLESLTASRGSRIRSEVAP